MFDGSGFTPSAQFQPGGARQASPAGLSIHISSPPCETTARWRSGRAIRNCGGPRPAPSLARSPIRHAHRKQLAALKMAVLQKTALPMGPCRTSAKAEEWAIPTKSRTVLFQLARGGRNGPCQQFTLTAPTRRPAPSTPRSAAPPPLPPIQVVASYRAWHVVHSQPAAHLQEAHAAPLDLLMRLAVLQPPQHILLALDLHVQGGFHVTAGAIAFGAGLVGGGGAQWALVAPGLPLGEGQAGGNSPGPTLADSASVHHRSEARLPQAAGPRWCAGSRGSRQRAWLWAPPG